MTAMENPQIFHFDNTYKAHYAYVAHLCIIHYYIVKHSPVSLVSIHIKKGKRAGKRKGKLLQQLVPKMYTSKQMPLLILTDWCTIPLI